MRRSLCLLVPTLLSLATTCLAQEIMVDTRRDDVQATVVAEPAVSTRLTPELWLYEQERIRMDDPALATVPSNHSPAYAPVIDPTLEIGVAALVKAVQAWLPCP